MVSYIIVDECPLLADIEVLARCKGSHVKQSFDHYKKEYPNGNVKVYKEVVL